MTPEITASRLLIAAFLISFISAFLRLLYILPLTQRRYARNRPRTNPSHLLVVLGSGGHTAEMLSLLRSLDTTRYTPRTYVISSGDYFSASKAEQFEQMLRQRQLGVKHSRHKDFDSQSDTDYEIITVPRARKIHQPLYTSPFSSLSCLWACILLLSRRKTSSPDMILTNGPATGVIVIFASLIAKFWGMQEGDGMKTIYVESWARVKSLSLSGKILLWGGLTDRFLVQWKTLETGRAEWRGFLVE